ncbi:hypothetical protein [Pedobacter jamesrossensis]|uniref:Uncharacterized protein n=1 Tax=Pedobacter jamesrossensis TaxID=1908238 RepID=A0ABV8NPD7_9SPHI
MNFLKKITIILLFLGIQYDTYGQKPKQRMHLNTTDDARVAIALTIDELPGQIFTFTMPEVFTLQGFEGGPGGLGNFNGQLWKFNNDGAIASLSDKNYNYTLNLSLVETKHKYSLKWKLVFKNNSDHALADLAAFNCVSMKLAPLFKDDNLDRTWVTDQKGKKKLIKNVAKTQGEGRRTMQFYPALGGIKDLSKSQWIQQWDVNSKEMLTGKKIYIKSNDSNWVLSNEVDGQVAYFFNNFEKTHGCVHASPLIAAVLAPGKTGVASGSINIIKQQN